jgi:hypothetical protein
MRGIQEYRGLTETKLLGRQTIVTVVHSATFEANESFGRFRVICSSVFSPNVR